MAALLTGLDPQQALLPTAAVRTDPQSTLLVRCLPVCRADTIVIAAKVTQELAWREDKISKAADEKKVGARHAALST